MNILFLTLAKINSLKPGTLYNDLVISLRDKGHNVVVVRPIEKRDNEIEGIDNFDGVRVIKVKTGNITKNKSFLEKGLSIITIEWFFKRAIKKYLKTTKFDLILYSTPPITFNRLISWLKLRDNARTYLMLKDIFPQNAIDMGLFSKNSIINKYFMNQEKLLYTISDNIGTISKANLEYIIDHHDVPISKVEVFPNAALIDTKPNYGNKEIIFNDLGLDTKLKTIIYGGNLGVPQDPEFLIEFSKKIQKLNDWQLIIIGSGSKYDYLESNIQGIQNVYLFPATSNNEYEKILSVCEIGLVVLSNKFTIPNFPCRILSYCKYSKPIVAMTDSVTDVKDLIEENDMGLWFESNIKDLDLIIARIKEWVESENLVEIGVNSRKILNEKFDIRKNIDIILKHLDKD